MASIRRGYSDDFTLKNNSVGIGTSTGQEALDVVDGAVKGFKTLKLLEYLPSLHMKDF